MAESGIAAGDSDTSGRFLAFAVDFALLGACSATIWVAFLAIQAGIVQVFGSISISSEAALGVIGVVRVVMWLAIGSVIAWYFVAMPAGEGQTYGKRFADVRVVTDEGSPVDRRAAAVRTAVLLLPLPLLAILNVVGTVWGFLVGLPFVLGWLLVETAVALLTTYTSDDQWRLGDWAAGTRVVAAVEPSSGDGRPEAEKPEVTSEGTV